MPTTEDPEHHPGEPVNRGPESPGPQSPVPDSGEPDSGLAHATPEQVDAAFARIVAGFDAASAMPAAESKATESKAAEGAAGGPAPGPVMPTAGPILNRGYGDPRAVGPDEPSLLDGLDTFGTGLPDDAPDHFEPPPPPPLPYIPIRAILSVLGIGFGLVLVLNTSLLPVDATMHLLLGAAGIAAGAAGLIMQLRPGDEDEEPPSDDGAVV